jgi:hypothetical protein
MFSTFVDVFLILKLKVGDGVNTDLADEGVGVSGTLKGEFFRQTVYKLV